MHFNGVSGKCLQCIQNMYKGIKPMLKINGMLSDFFNCNIVVRQGENLSPFLFTLYINDLEEFSVEKMYKGYIVYQMILRMNFIYFKLLVLFYADDCVILADSDVELQNALNEFKMYCSNWNLNVNVEKTKILVFSKGYLLKTKFIMMILLKRMLKNLNI